MHRGENLKKKKTLKTFIQDQTSEHSVYTNVLHLILNLIRNNTYMYEEED